MRVHSKVLVPLKGSSILATSLIKSYCMNGLLREARQLFDEIPNRDVVAWTAMITGYRSCGRFGEAWALFCEMKKEGGVVEPNAFTMSSVLKACKGMKSNSCGAMVHGLVIKYGVNDSLYVEHTLMDMYATCSGSMDNAWLVFETIRVKNSVSWTTMIAGYTHRGDGYAAVRVLRRMLQQEGLELNDFTCSIAIRACASIGSYSMGRQIHGAAVKHGFESSTPVGNSLVDMYCRCSSTSMSEAYRYFNQMLERDLITWNTMIAGFERSGSHESLHLFCEMGAEGLSPNCFTFTSAAAACGNLAVLNCGQQVHGGIIQRGFATNVALANSLIDMYAKCGSVSDSWRIFNEMPERDLISWTSMMNAHGTHGHGREAIQLFNEMVVSGIKPDQVVFMGVLSACSHAGLIEDGLRYFDSMTAEHHVKPNKEIYGCVVDLLGRAGRVAEAYEIIKTMPFAPDELVWGALLGACKAHNVSHLAGLAAKEIVHLRPNRAVPYVVLSNMYAADGRWGEFAKMRKLIKGICNKKEAGRSWIEVRNQVYSFVVGEKFGEDIELLYEWLEVLTLHIREAGYVSDSNSLIHYSDYEI
ncbi:hypothetical protein Sjap_007236 [Stephania japonica]|uniref:Pentatricopeptide repeat-containing protein n=1 Tax=Stephania japonica TaxID=461633 RepID=A0AAP0PA87_9MAGN